MAETPAQANGSAPIDTSGSIPPPSSAELAVTAGAGTTTGEKVGVPALGSETEALARLGAIAAEAPPESRPSRAIIGTAITLGALVVALVLLAVVLSL